MYIFTWMLRNLQLLYFWHFNIFCEAVFAMLLASVISSPFIKELLGKSLLTLDCCNRSLMLVHVRIFNIMFVYFEYRVVVFFVLLAGCSILRFCFTCLS